MSFRFFIELYLLAPQRFFIFAAYYPQVLDASKILVIGASGQIGIELVNKLREIHGSSNVVASDIRIATDQSVVESGPWELVNVLNSEGLLNVIKKHNIDTVYNLAAMLSATAEQYPDKGWDLNMNGHFNILDLARDGHLKKIFWPSSIAVFGPTTPKTNTGQYALCEPTTVYGISKQAGERWCEYYNQKWGVDVRSIRYPGLIGYKSAPGGGTTDYAVDIFQKAVDRERFTCPLDKNMSLPMMYMEDAIRSTIELTEAPQENVKIRSSYNISGLSFSPDELAAEIKKHHPNFEIAYDVDFRNDIAATWPDSIDDTEARNDWAWKSKFDLSSLTEIMLNGLQKKKVEAETF